MCLFTIGGFASNTIASAEQAKGSEVTETRKSIVFKNNVRNTNSNSTPFDVEETPGRTRFDYDSLTKLMEEHKTPLSAMTPEWLNLAIEHRTRYDVYDNGFTRDIPGYNDQIHQRTRFLFEIEKIIDPLRFTLELTDIRAPLAKYDQEHSPIFANHFDFTQLHLDLVSKDFLGTGYGAKFEVGRLILEYGESRLVGGIVGEHSRPLLMGCDFR
ncbi:MAG TPA: alginate export family protein [Nitrosomonas nitrosa]|nr:alginate export family protein [Nitrosomonas nitrosa]